MPVCLVGIHGQVLISGRKTPPRGCLHFALKCHGPTQMLLRQDSAEYSHYDRSIVLILGHNSAGGLYLGGQMTFIKYGPAPLLISNGRANRAKSTPSGSPSLRVIHYSRGRVLGPLNWKGENGIWFPEKVDSRNDSAYNISQNIPG